MGSNALLIFITKSNITTYNYAEPTRVGLVVRDWNSVHKIIGLNLSVIIIDAQQQKIYNYAYKTDEWKIQ